MKNKIIITTGILLFFFTNLFAQNFEGVITMNMNTPEKNERATIQWKMKNGNNRLEYTGTQGDKPFTYVFIFSNTGSKVKILTETNGQKVVYTSNIPPSNTDNERYYEHSFTGSRKVIDKYAVEQITLKSAEKRTACWISKDVPLTIDMLPPMLKANGVLNYFLLRKIEGFPMEIESFDAAGKLIFSQKITAVKPVALSDDEFVVGSEYIDPAKVMKVDMANPSAAPQK
jgi:hypothetical protein